MIAVGCFRLSPFRCNIRGMQIHGSCAARDGVGVLLTGAPGIGKSDLVLRLIARGFVLVADDRVEIDGLDAGPPAALAGLLEVRGLGIVTLPFAAPVRLALAVELARDVPRLPYPARHPRLDVPLVRLDPERASAPEMVALALDCALGRVRQTVGASAA